MTNSLIPGNDTTFLLRHTREELLRLLPKRSVVAEIGVAHGEFSSLILRDADPERLHLIDPWAHQDDAGYSRDPNNVSDAEQDERYGQVRARFSDEIASGRVVLHRSRSTDAARTFAPSCFDWVYLDAMHTHEAVLADLRAFAPLVRPDGLICGHDYANHPSARAAGFGVVEAVNRFVAERGGAFVALTDEAFPTYVLARSGDAPQARALRAQILKHMRFIMVRHFTARHYQQHAVKVAEDKPARICICLS